MAPLVGRKRGPYPTHDGQMIGMAGKELNSFADICRDGAASGDSSARYHCAAERALSGIYDPALRILIKRVP
jgi:hypothetical protein